MRTFIGKQTIFQRVALELHRGTNIPCEGCFIEAIDPSNSECPMLKSGRRDCEDIYRAIWRRVAVRQGIAQSAKQFKLCL